MKKIKMIVFFFVMIFCLNYLVSCGRGERIPSQEMKPKVTLSNQNIDYSSISFDLQVTEPENVTIEEIYIRVYKNSNIVWELCSKDGINKVGLTEDIVFIFLESSTSYKIDFVFDYLLGNKKKENEVIYSYNFVTTEKNKGVSGTISNWILNTSSITFDATFKDDNKIVSDFKICLYLGTELVSYLNATEGINSACNFDLLLPAKEYTVILCATFLFDGEQYTDYILDKKQFKTSDSSHIPTAEISNLLVENDIVTFDLTLKDEFNALTKLSVVLTDNNNTTLAEKELKENELESGEHTISFSWLEPHKDYLLKVLANYTYDQEVVTENCLTEKSFSTGDYSFDPTAEISNLLVENDIVTFDLTLKDDFNVLTSLSIVLTYYNDTTLAEKELKEKESEPGDYTISFSGVEPYKTYQLRVLANYTYNQKVVTENLLTEETFSTGDYSFAPTAEISNVKVNKDTVSFKCTITDERELLTSLTIGIRFDEGDIFKEISFESGLETYECSFSKLEPDTNYTLFVSGKYNYSTEVISRTLDSLYIRTTEYEFYPTIVITNVLLQEDGIAIDYYLSDPFSLLTDLNFELLTMDNENVISTNLSDKMTNGFHRIQLDNIKLNKFKIKILADYSCLSLQKESEIIGELDYVENSKNDFEYSVTDAGVIINKYISTSKTCIIPKEIDGKKVTILADYAFYSSNVKEVIIPDSIVHIGKFAFYGCRNLKSICIPEGITRLESNLFETCNNLISIVLPSSITSIGDYVFAECERLVNISIPDNVTSIGECAFEDCINLSSIALSSSITTIGDDAFFYCENLTDVYYEGTIEDWLNISFGNIYSNPKHYASNFYLKNDNNEWEEITSLDLPNTVIEVGKYHFYSLNNFQL